MTVAALIRKFADRYHLPVEVEDVVQELRERGIKDEIYFFWDHQISTGSLSGFIQHWDYIIDGEPRRCADITYAKSNNELERLVSTKEMLHILDPAYALVANDAEIEGLMEKIILPPDMVDLATDGIHALTDRVAVAQALAVLFPLAARQALLQPYKDKKISLEAIADRAELPPRYVAAVMSDTWEQTLAILEAMGEN